MEKLNILEQLLTERDVARITGMSLGSVRRWRLLGHRNALGTLVVLLAVAVVVSIWIFKLRAQAAQLSA